MEAEDHTPAWHAGYESFWQGHGPRSNPHPIPGGRAAEWDRGWRDAETEWRKAGPEEVEYETGCPVG